MTNDQEQIKEQWEEVSLEMIVSSDEVIPSPPPLPWTQLSIDIVNPHPPNSKPVFN